MSGVTVEHPVTGPRRVGAREALSAEWTKLRTWRATVWTAAVVAPLVVALAVFVGLTESLQPDDTVLGGSLTGAVLGQLAAAIFGVLAVTGECGSGMIRLSFTAVPRRGLVMAAKAVLVWTVTFVVALAGGIAAYAVGSALLAGEAYARGEPWPALLGVAACLATTALLGLAVGALIRHSAGAITVLLAVLLLPAMFAPLLGGLERWVNGASPQTVLQKLTQTSDVTAQNAGSLSGWPSLAVLGGYTALLLIIGTLRMARRDA